MIIVVGGTSGIGLATAQNLQAQGYDVVIAGRKKPASSHLSFQHVELRDEKSIEELFAQFEAIEGLVFSAGITMPKQSIEKFEKQKFYEMMDVNVTALLLCLKYAYRKLKKHKAKIVVVNSLAARKGSPISGIEYTTTKAALSGVVKQLSLEFASDGILINSVFPSMTATPMLLEHTDEKKLQKIESTIPLGRVAQPSEVAKAIEFLLSSKNSYMTGCGIDINGGLFLSS